MLEIGTEMEGENMKSAYHTLLSWIQLKTKCDINL
jgi:hypothetical protein